MRVVVAGARGFIGSALIPLLKADSRIQAVYSISRSAGPDTRVADLASLRQTRDAVAGATHAIYLVHSMSPQAKLAQGRFADFDLLQADNFARACRHHGIQNILYLGGILPGKPSEETNWSDHLRSRLEVERALAAYGAKVTALRAGLILGVGGSSSEMLMRLVRRLPFMLAPRWTQTKSDPVDVTDAVRAIHEILFREDLQGSDWDLSSGEQLTYVDLMHRAATALRIKRRIIGVPIVSPGVSKLWVSLVSGAPRALVYPLIRSLRYAMIARPDHLLLPKLGVKPTTIAESIAHIVGEPEIKDSKPAAYSRYPNYKQRPTVRSIQRFGGLTPEALKRIGSLADRYFEWLPRFLIGILAVEKERTLDVTRITFRLWGTRIRFLELESEYSVGIEAERFKIVGGILQRPGSGGTLEFRALPAESCALAIVQDFIPRLPWMIYRATQAVLHQWVMRRFGKSLD
jgi:nucleoside-diphosphate-sugar epimerase